MSINAFFFAEGQQLEEEEEGVKLLMKLLDKQDGQNEVVHIIRCCQMFARVSVLELHSAKRKDPTCC